MKLAKPSKVWTFLGAKRAGKTCDPGNAMLSLWYFLMDGHRLKDPELFGSRTGSIQKICIRCDEYQGYFIGFYPPPLFNQSTYRLRITLPKIKGAAQSIFELKCF